MTRTPQRLGFIHLVPFDGDHPKQGFADAIELFRFAESLGLDGGWVRTRHLQRGLPSPAVLFGALSLATSRIDLGTAVIPVGHENPFRLAEDLATADVLSGGRVQAGLSVHGPGYPSDAVNDAVHGAGWREEGFGYERIARLRSLLAGDAVREVLPYNGIGGDFDSARVEPHSAGLADRLWYGGGSLRSAEWAGAAGFNWLVSNISTSENGVTDFSTAQRNQIDAYRAAREAPANERVATEQTLAGAATARAASGGRVAVARVIVPTDGTSPDQRTKYEQYAQARTPRTLQVQGVNTLIARDVLGSEEEIVAYIQADPAFQAADDYLFELPFEFQLDDWKQILTQLATRIGPALGWKPAAGATR